MPPDAFVQPSQTGWVSLESSPYVVYCSFMETYAQQLNHTNPLVCASTQHRSLQAKLRFHSYMPCLANSDVQACLSRPNDHNRFLILCFRLHVEVHVPSEVLHLPPVHNAMWLCRHEWQAADIHTWMDAIPLCARRCALGSLVVFSLLN